MGKKKQAVASLGRSLIRDKQKKPAMGLSSRHTTDDGTDWARLNLRSVTEENTLDQFLATATLAGTEFTAERENLKIVDPSGPAIPSEEQRNAIASEQASQPLLMVPRRPDWDLDTSPDELERRENDSFLAWRRRLAQLEERDSLTMTPFEKNLELWRQLWRVVEKSDVVVQILDARNPLLFLCRDLQRYVEEVSRNKLNVILLNKADLLTARQRHIWAQHFDDLGVAAVFFSALEQSAIDNDEQIEGQFNRLQVEMKNNPSYLLSRDELVLYLKRVHGDRIKLNPKMTTVGLVGYPNVGKSSTINALLKSKHVSVSATPGKTKHFQTLFLDQELMLCDCPGLVFPNVVSCKAEMIINGILPIDQMTDHIAPVSLLTRLIPRHVFESTYGIAIAKPAANEDPNRNPTAEELLNAYGLMRGFMTQRGLPDTARAARYILKHLVNGKLLYCYAPPGHDQREYQSYPERLSHKERATELNKDMGETNQASTTDFDEMFFAKNQTQVHSKGVSGIVGQGKSLVRDGTETGKPWKKHHNRNKREKLRRVYKHLDQ